MTRFVPDRGGIAALLRNPPPELERALRNRADAVADEAHRIAQAEAFDTGDYDASIEVKESTGPDGRKGFIVEASDFKALWIEYGSQTNPRVRTLGRAADAGG